MGEPLNVGVIGCGVISDQYATAAPDFPAFDLIACADIDPTRARTTAETYGLRACDSVADLLDDPDIDIVLNLTTPEAHTEVARAALMAGKHVYSEKPLAVTREEARTILEIASEQRLRVGCAPDTFLGTGAQAARAEIDKGTIGEPVAATALMLSRGHERWHPQPDFYYQRGGGPMLDMGPYYLTVLASLLGPIQRVASSARMSFPQRVIASEPRRGELIDVEVPTHIAGVADFVAGPVATVVTSFDVWATSRTAPIEIYGSEGTITLPDPNGFTGAVHVWDTARREWSEIPPSAVDLPQARGLGVNDMAESIRSGRPHRASGRLAYHVLDAMHAFLESSERDSHVLIESRADRPGPLPP